MSLTLSNLKPAKGATAKRKRVGRGGKRGTYSGRGLKGQRSRSGGKAGLKALGLKSMIKSLPKTRGFKSLKPKMVVVNVSDLETKFADGDIITLSKLVSSGLIDSFRTGVKVLGNGQLSKKLTVSAHGFSASAKKLIENAGGKVDVIEIKKYIKPTNKSKITKK